MQKLTNRYLLIAAALFLVLSAYAVPAQNITASLQDARAGSGGSVTSHVQDQSTGPAVETNRFAAPAGWFDLLMPYITPRSRAVSRLEAARSQTLAAKEKLAGDRATEFAW